MSTAHFAVYITLELLALGIVIICIVYGALLAWDWLADRWHW